MNSLIARLVEFQIRRPWWPIVFVAVITLFFGFFALQLKLRMQYDALLPPSAPSVQELRRLEKRSSSAQTVLVLLEGADRQALRRMGDRVVPALVALGPSIIGSAEDGLHDARRFFLPRAGLFLSRAALEQLKIDVDARWEYEVSKASGTLLDSADPPPPIDASSFTDRFSTAAHALLDRFPDGYYERADGKALIVVVRSPIPGGDLSRVEAALGAIRRTVTEVRSSSAEFGAVRISFAGDMPTGLSEYGVILKDLVNVGALGIGLILAAVLFYFLRARAVLVMAITIFVGLVWTFGVTQLVIGHLNVATAFLVSIVAGNGINVGILYQARYFEERNAGKSAEDALRTAVRETWLPTIIAALAAAASYGSLLATDFRAFRDFGFIAATGMLLCWIVKTLLVPPLLLLSERMRHERPAKLRWLGPWEMAYGRPFAWLVPRAPHVFRGLGFIVAMLGTIAVVLFVLRDPMEHDMRKVENDRSHNTELHRAWSVCNDILGTSQGAMIIATDTAEEARELVASLWARWEAAPRGDKPFVAVHSLADFVPADQEAKLPTLLALGERLRRAGVRGFLKAEDWNTVRALLPPPGLTPFNLDDLPISVSSPFTETNGTRGTLVLVESTTTASSDVRELLRYADSFRATRLASGKIVRGSGRVVIFADMLGAVARDVPRATALSLGLTLITVFVTFWRRPHRSAVFFTLWVAFAGVALYLFASGTHLNFLNFAALPVTFGIGADYAVNVAQRYTADGSRDPARVLATSGGAVVLCSLTTMLGYLALLGSHNRAIRSLGSIAAMGEVCCILGAVVVLPAVWLAAKSVRRSPVTSKPLANVSV